MRAATVANASYRRIVGKKLFGCGSRFPFLVIAASVSSSSAHSSWSPVVAADVGHRRRWMGVVAWTPPPIKVGLVGAAFQGGQLRAGVDDGPTAIRSGGSLEAVIRSMGHTVKNYNDLRVGNLTKVAAPVPGSKMRGVHIVGSYTKELSRRVEESVRHNDLTVILGGDHSISLGSVHGHAAAGGAEEGLAVIWVDAHADINTPSTSKSKNGHGMVLPFLCREMRGQVDDEADGVAPLSWLRPPISCKQLAYIGLRDLDPAEKETLKHFEISAYDIDDVDKIGAKEAIRRSLIHVDPHQKLPIHLSVDIDSLCPKYTPSTGTPVHGGLTPREVIQIVEIVAATGRLRCLDVTEVNPKIGSADDVRKTVQAAHAVILAACGNQRAGNVTGLVQDEIAV